MANPKHRWLAWAVRAIGPILLVVLIARIDQPRELWNIVRAGAPLTLLGALALNLVPLHLKVWRWQTLLARAGHHYSLGGAYRAVLPSLYLGMVTPGRIGDLLRVQYARHEAGAPYSEALAVSAMDRFCDLYVLGLFAAGGIARFAGVLSPALSYLAWVGVAVALLAPLVFLVPSAAPRLLRPVYARFSQGHEPGGLERFMATLRRTLDRALLLGVPLTLASFLTNYLQCWLVARAIGFELSYVDTGCIVAITSLLSLLPVSVSGLGVREAFAAMVFPALGHPATAGVAFGLLVFVTLYVFYVAVGFVAWQLAPPPFGFGLPQDQDADP